MQEIDHQSSPSMAVVDAVADAKGVEPTDLSPPLAAIIDPDALDALFPSEGTVGRVDFEYCGCDVTVYSDGTVEADVTVSADRSAATVATSSSSPSPSKG